MEQGTSPQEKSTPVILPFLLFPLDPNEVQKILDSLVIQSTPELVNVNSPQLNMPATSHSTEKQNQKHAPGFLSPGIPQKKHKSSETSSVLNENLFNDFSPSTSGLGEGQNLVRSSSEESVIELPHEPKPLYIPKEEPMSLEENYEKDEGNIKKQLIAQEKLKILSVEKINKKLYASDSLKCHSGDPEFCETSEKIKAIRRKKLISIKGNSPSNQQDSKKFSKNFMDTSKPSGCMNCFLTEGGTDSSTKELLATLEKSQGNRKLVSGNVGVSGVFSTCSKGPESDNNRPPGILHTPLADEGYYSKHVGEELNVVRKPAPVQETVLENRFESVIKMEVMLPEDDLNHKVTNENLPVQQSDDVSSLSTPIKDEYNRSQITESVLEFEAKVNIPVSPQVLHENNSLKLTNASIMETSEWSNDIPCLQMEEGTYVSLKKSLSAIENGECSSGNSSTFSRNSGSIDRRVQQVSSEKLSKASEKENLIVENSPTYSKNLENFDKISQQIPKTPAITENRKKIKENSPSCSKDLDIVNRGNQQNPHRTLFADEYSRANVVKNFNAAKRTEVTNEFNLAKIFAENNFTFRWGVIKSNVDGNNYNVRDIVLPPDGRFKRFFEIICSVFSAPVNCGYFNEEERNFVFKILTLREEEQDFLMEFLLGTKGEWFFPRERHYDREPDVKIQEELFEQMLQMGLLESAYKSFDGTFFDIFNDAFLQEIYRSMRLDPPKTRKKIISTLTEIFRRENNANVNDDPHQIPLTFYLRSQKGPILRLSPTLISITHRILTIYFPDHNPHHQHFSKIFSIITKTLDPHNPTKYPLYRITRLPLFSNRQSLMDYVEAKFTLTKINEIIKEKSTGYCKNLTTYGNQILGKLEQLVDAIDREDSERRRNERRSVYDSHLRKTESPKLPPHIQQFLPSYLWSKILITIIGVFGKQKTDDSLRVARKYLAFLLSNRDKIPVDSSTLYKEAINIEWKRSKHLKRAGESIINSFEVLQHHDCRLHIAEMHEIAKNFVKKNSKVAHLVLIMENLRKKINENDAEFSFAKPTSLKFEFDPVPGPDRLKDEILNHYTKSGYPKGVNCCELLPVTLFACIFWGELYDPQNHVPGAFVSKFQKGPLDLFKTGFDGGRKVRMLKKLSELERQGDDKLWSLMSKVYRDSFSVESIVSHSFGDHNEFKGMIKCVRKKGVLGICRSLVEGKCTDWGFPDLFVWNERHGGCKAVFVLVRSNQTLLVAQKLWNKVLEISGIRVDNATYK